MGTRQETDQPIHGLLLRFDAAHQGKLRARAVEIVPGPFDFEIPIPVKIVGEEPQANFEGDQLAGKISQRAADLSEGRILSPCTRARAV